MLNVPKPLREFARIALGLIRLFNGIAALIAPGWLIRRLGVDPATNPAAFYAFRLFGIRTILIGKDLLSKDEEQRSRALRVAVVIHASDVMAALLAGFSKQIPAARTITIISVVNTILAKLAQPVKK